MRPASLKDIAASLRLSVATVSRALQGNAAISPATRKRVEAEAERIGYKKNFIADTLRQGGHLPVIGVVAPHAVTHFYASVLDGIESVAAAAGYAVVSMNSRESPDEECRCLQSLATLHVSGIIASITQATTDIAPYRELQEAGIPVVFVARGPAGGEFATVEIDNQQSAYRATMHLYQEGRRRIAMLCGPRTLPMVANRKHGYIEALHQLYLPVRPDYVAYTDIDNASAIDATCQLLDLPERPDAIIAINDTLLLAALRAIRTSGLNIPADIALLGYSDAEYTGDLTPALTTIEDPSHDMGREAAKLLLERIGGGTEPKRIVLQSHMAIRRSSRKG